MRRMGTDNPMAGLIASRCFCKSCIPCLGGGFAVLVVGLVFVSDIVLIA